MSRQNYYRVFVFLSTMGILACSADEGSLLISDRECTKSSDCEDPDYPVCRNNKCAAGYTSECEGDEDCEDEELPVCKKGKCTAAEQKTECTSNKDCTDPELPVCKDGKCIENAETPESPECTSNDDCTNPDLPVCKDGKCSAAEQKSECTSNDDCTDPDLPVCKDGKCSAAEQKSECTSNDDCTNPDLPVCKDGKCIENAEAPEKPECTSNNDCTNPDLPICENEKCVPKVECKTASDCKDKALPLCESNKCIAVKAEADLLDVVFNADGSATNIAPTQVTIQTVKGDALTTSFDSSLNRYTAYFGNNWSAAASNYYRVEYSSDPDFMTKFSDGHTVEVVAKLGQEYPGATSIKPFASLNEGGFAVMLSGTNSDSALSFVTMTNKTTAVVSSGIKPKAGRYYHIVGTWDKSEQKIYIDGELKKTAKTSGDYKDNSEKWIAIGASTKSTASVPQSWNGDVAIARIYSEPLSAERIRELYEASKVAETLPFIQDVDALGTGEITVGYEYYVYGKGFKEGDFVRFESTTGGKSFDAKTSIDGDHVTAIIPEGMVTDEYRTVLVRGEKIAELDTGKLTVIDHAPMLTRYKCVAHQGGHWASLTGGSKSSNSIAALKAAQDLDVYAVELDIRSSKDGVIYVAHDDYTGGVTISSSTAATVDSKSKLGNGEHVPRFEAYLDEAKKKPTVKLVVELKQGSIRSQAYQMVKDKGMLDQVWWLVDLGSGDAMRKVVEDPETPVLVMSGTAPYDVNGSCSSTSANEVNKRNLTVNYGFGCVTNTHISQSHANGKLIGVWTVNLGDNDSRCPGHRSCIRYWMNRGVDLITTNSSPRMMEILTVYAKDPKTMK